MNARRTTFLALTLTALALPAAAQAQYGWHGQYGEPGMEPDRPEWRDPQPSWNGYGAQGWEEEAGWDQDVPAPAYGVPAAQAYGYAYHAGAAMGPGMSYGYTPAQRDAWMRDCIESQVSTSRRNGPLIGGVIGAAAGAVAGNRLVDKSRLVGGIVGGLGGAVVGSVIGAIIDRDSKRSRESEAEAFCEDYLARYTHSAAASAPAPYPAYGQGYVQPGYGHAPGYGGYAAYPQAMGAPVTMVPVGRPGRTRVEEIVTEEWVEVPPVRTAHRVIHSAPAPAARMPVRSKLIPIK